MCEYFAHYREADHKPQSVKEHLIAVKNLAESFGEPVGVKHITGLAGVLHDIGKYTDRFQDYLYQAVFKPESNVRRGDVDHSSAGGKLLYDLLHREKPDKFRYILSEVVGNAIISHHSYLHDFFSPKPDIPFYVRVTKSEEKLPGYSNAIDIFYREVFSKEMLASYIDQAVEELILFLKNNPGNPYEKLTLLIRFVFSSLIDADRTDTRLFEEHQTPQTENISCLFRNYYDRLMNRLASFNSGSKSLSKINQLRKEMSLQCERYARNPSGIYTLSIPTGGGKTLASFRYALVHALKFKKKQIIYVVPFTTIIEQNAKVIRSIVKDDIHILEHHSNVVDNQECAEKDEDEGVLTVKERLRLAKDNWDCPIILTTMVQFLNTFYKYGSRNIRRLHHLSNSIIVFDEVQKVPIQCVSLFNEALNFLARFGKASILLCTATQPALNYVRHSLAIKKDTEIIHHLDCTAAAFKRVEIVDRSYRELFNTEKLSNFIFEQLKTVNNVLVVLNTKSVVRQLYQAIKVCDVPINIFHLSTSMCAKHREAILEKVKHCLKTEQKMVCISTQLIEAGVDVSFECVIRSLAGLDSIAQAAGRCNRNGEYSGYRKVFIIDHEEEKLQNLIEIDRGKSITKKILKDFHDHPSQYNNDLLSKPAMDWYFKNYYSELEGKLDFDLGQSQGTLVSLLNASRKNSDCVKSFKRKYGKENIPPLFLPSSLRTAAKEFYVIRDTTSILVPYGYGKEIIADLGSSQTIDDLGQLLKKAQQYSVNIYEQEKKRLEQENLLIPYLDGLILTINEAAYSDEFGLDLGGKGELNDYVF